MLLTAEQTKVVSESNVISNRNFSNFRGHEQISGRGSHRGGYKPAQNNNKSQHKNALTPNHNKGKEKAY